MRRGISGTAITVADFEEGSYWTLQVFPREGTQGNIKGTATEEDIPRFQAQKIARSIGGSHSGRVFKGNKSPEEWE